MKNKKQMKDAFNHQLNMLDPEIKQEEEIIPHQSLMKKPIFVTTILIIFISIMGSFFTSGFEAEGTAEEVIANRVSSATTAGEKLFENEINTNIEARDFEVTNAGPDGGEARMLIWDINKIDYDEVAIFVDGQPVKEKLIISENPAAISIPVPSVVTITGLKDTGGGISYAVKFPNNRSTYFNVVTVGQSNSYTVLPKP